MVILLTLDLTWSFSGSLSSSMETSGRICRISVSTGRTSFMASILSSGYRDFINPEFTTERSLQNHFRNLSRRVKNLEENFKTSKRAFEGMCESCPSVPLFWSKVSMQLKWFSLKWEDDVILVEGPKTYYSGPACTTPLHQGKFHSHCDTKRLLPQCNCAFVLSLSFGMEAPFTKNCPLLVDVKR